jgi:hypothetical protein
MEIVYQGQHDALETAKGLAEVLVLLNKRYQIADFREIRLSVTLVNAQGEDVELVDNETNQVFRHFELREPVNALQSKVRDSNPGLKLVVDNTNINKL